MAYETHSDAWLREITHTAERGDVRSPRGMITREIRWTQFMVTNPMTFPVAVEGRSFANVVGVLEGLSLVGQVNVPESFTDRVMKFSEFTDAGVFHGAYGTRVAGRLGDLVSLLARDADTRQAVLTIYDSRSDLGALKRDVPCTVALQFMVHGHGLEMKVMMRSNDLWLGTPYDLMQFSILQGAVAQALGLYPSLYVHSVGSLHLYERDVHRFMKLGDVRRPNEDWSWPLFRAGRDIGEISSRARRILLQQTAPETEFERWCADVLR